MAATCDDDTVTRHWPQPDTGCAVPYEAFTSQAYYDLEQDRIFRGDTWSFVGLAAEVPNAGDFKSTRIGETPVILVRDEEGTLNVLQNRCAHRGALVCRERRGTADSLQCVYHQWTYDLQGRLRGVPFRKGVRGQGGMPDSFDMAAFGLDALRVDAVGDMVFATFSDAVEPLRDYLGPMICDTIERIFNRPIALLGDQRQAMNGNWKLYAENTRDPYHASLLHLFHTTFGLYSTSQEGASLVDATHKHSMLYTKSGTTDKDLDRKTYEDSRSFDAEFALADPSVLAGRPEFDDGITLVIMTVFPNVVLQQIANTLAVRQTVTESPDRFELVWTHFGFADDDAEMQAIRIKQSNLIGPAGYISMEDGEAVELVQKAVRRDGDKRSYIAMGGGRAEDTPHIVTESAIVGFWESYRDFLGIAV